MLSIQLHMTHSATLLLGCLFFFSKEMQMYIYTSDIHKYSMQKHLNYRTGGTSKHVLELMNKWIKPVISAEWALQPRKEMLILMNAITWNL